MNILATDTSTESCSVCIFNENKILGEFNLNCGNSHSLNLMDLIDDLLSFTNLSIDKLDGFALANGPGSFTGLRIAYATIKGLSFSTNKPFVSVSTLESFAYSLKNQNTVICPIIDALRGNVYTNLSYFNNDNLNKLMNDCIINFDELIEFIISKNLDVTFIGSGVKNFQDKILSLNKNFKIAPINQNFSRASNLVLPAMMKFKNNEIEDIDLSHPEYLLKSQAEQEYDRKNIIS